MSTRISFKTLASSALVLSLICCLSFAGAASARHPWIDELEKKSDQSLSQLDKLKTELDSTSPDDWSEAVLVEYSIQSLWAVYYALDAYVLDKKSIPADLNQLVSTGYLQAMPLNPQNNWQPVEVRSPGSAFAAGDLVLELCPSESYSLVGWGATASRKPLSYQLTVLGPARDHKHASKVDPVKGNEWANIPEGALMTLGSFTESAMQTEEKKRVRDEQVRKTQEDTGKG